MIEEFEHVHREGGLLGSYKGCGFLNLQDGTRRECDFLVEHHVELGVLLECESDEEIPFWIKALSFDGTGYSEEMGEFSIRSIQVLQYTGSHICSSGKNKNFYTLDAVKLEKTNKAIPLQARYGVTNFMFYPIETHPTIENKVNINFLPLSLDTELGLLAVEIEQDCEYKITSDYLRSYHSIRVTCEAVVRFKAGEFSESTDSVIGGLCQVMSVAKGTRIVWAYRHLFDADNQLCEIYHHSAWVGRFFSMPVFADGPQHRYDVKRFLEGAYPIFRQKHVAFELGNNLIESYLSAKAEGDLLERRGVKLAVTLELLKHLYVKQDDCPAKEHVIPERKFEKISKGLRRVIRSELEGHSIEENDIHEICQKTKELNKTNFKHLLRSAFASVGFEPSEEEISVFAKQRNFLIHTGHFYDFKSEDRNIIYYLEDGKTASEFEEDPCGLIAPSYYFMVNLIDRFFLKFFNYSGPYINKKINLAGKNVGTYDTLA